MQKVEQVEILISLDLNYRVEHERDKREEILAQII